MFFQNAKLLEIGSFWDGDSWPLLRFKASNVIVPSAGKTYFIFARKATKYFHGKKLRRVFPSFPIFVEFLQGFFIFFDFVRGKEFFFSIKLQFQPPEH